MIEKSEVNKLASEMKTHGVRDAKDVSAYIKKHDLTKSFSHICAIKTLVMEKNGEPEFICDGGIIPEHYRKLCIVLGFVRRESEYSVFRGVTKASPTAPSDWDEYSELMAR